MSTSSTLLKADSYTCSRSTPGQTAITSPQPQVVIFDSQVDDLAQLLSGLLPDIRAYVLDPMQDGIEQITEILQQQPTMDLTIVAHGFPGGLQLGAGTLELNNLPSYSRHLQSWFSTLPTAQLTLLSCNVAAGDAGSEFVEQLYHLTQAQITSADYAIGNGQWLPNAAEIFTVGTLANYRSTLNWSLVGLGGFSEGVPDGSDLEIDRNGTPYVVYKDLANSELINVKKFDGSAWVNVGAPGFSAGSVSFTDLEFDHNNTPYVVFKDAGNNSRATVMTFNGTSWVNVGQPGFSVGGLKDLDLAFDNNGNAYVAYTDRSQNSKATVVTFNGTDWVPVGQAGFSTAEVETSDLKVDSSGILYIAYVSDQKVTVQKFNGTNWVTVGTEGFSVGVEATLPNLEFDSNDVPYIVYRARGDGQGNKAIVQRFDGNSWVNVGDSGASIAGGFHPDIEFDSAGTLHLAIVDQAKLDKVSVRKFDGTNWVDVGTAGFSDGPINFPDLEFDPNDIPYVLYRDTENSGRATVQKFSTTTAPTLTSIARKTPVEATTDEDTLVFQVIFSEVVTNIDAADFIVTGGTTAVITNLTPVSGRVYDITVAGGNLADFDGTVGLDLAASQDITDLDDIALATAAPQIDETYTVVNTPIDTIAPLLTGLTRKTPGDEVTSSDTLIFQATFSEAVQSVDSLDFVVNGSATATVTNVALVTDNTYDITVAGGDLASFNGTIGIDLSDTQTITDLANNQLLTLEPTLDETYTLVNDSSEPGPTEPGPTEPGPTEPGPTEPGPTEPLLPLALLTPLSGLKALEVTQLGNAKVLSLTVETSNIDSVSDITIFSTDGTGNSRNPIGSFSLLQGDQLPVTYVPLFNLASSLISTGSLLQFELTENGISRIAEVSTLSQNNEISLDFGNGTELITSLETLAPDPNLLVNDAAAIDLTNYTGPLNARFTVYRESALDNKVGFYTTDFVDGGIRTFDALTGEKILRPGSIGYKEAALANRLDIELTGENEQVSTFNGTITSGAFLGTFVMVDGVDPAIGEVYFSHQGANGNSRDHSKHLGDNTFGFEDQLGLGDRDFNDLVVQIDVTPLAAV